MMMPRIFSKAWEPTYERPDKNMDRALPVDRAPSKAKDHAVDQPPGAVKTSPLSTGRDTFDTSLKLLCGHPDLIPKRHDTDPWCLPILRTEALLRLSEDYIAQTQRFYDSGSMPPGELDEEVEAKALRMHGLALDDVPSYRHATCNLTIEQRKDIFFLRANDRLFRPRAAWGEKKLQGTVHRIDGAPGPVQLEEILNLPRAFVVASTSS